MSEHEHKLDVFGQWYELHKALKTMDKTDPKYQELATKCEGLKQKFNSMFVGVHTN